MYHPHADEMVQMAMGMMGLCIIHPKDPTLDARSTATSCSCSRLRHRARAAATPKIMRCSTSTSGRGTAACFPGIDPLVARTGDRVRIRIGNLTMTNHPIHLHGPTSSSTGTDGGWVPPAARWPEVTTDVAVGQMRAIEFDARSRATGPSTATSRTTR